MRPSCLTNSEIERIKRYANFTKEEEKIFILLTKEKSIKEISCTMLMSTRTVDRKISIIKSKIKRI